MSCAFVLFLKIRRPTNSTRTYTLIPYTTLLRSPGGARDGVALRNVYSAVTTSQRVLAGLMITVAACLPPARGWLESDMTRHMLLQLPALLLAGALLASGLPPKITRSLAAYNAHGRSEEHTSELQSLMRISYAVFCLKKKIKTNHKN